MKCLEEIELDQEDLGREQAEVWDTVVDFLLLDIPRAQVWVWAGDVAGEEEEEAGDEVLVSPLIHFLIIQTQFLLTPYLQ